MGCFLSGVIIGLQRFRNRGPYCVHPIYSGYLEVHGACSLPLTGCFCKSGVLLAGVLITRADYFGCLFRARIWGNMAWPVLLRGTLRN